MQVVVRERAVLERIGDVAGLLQVPVVEGVGVEDDRAALRQVGQVGSERGGIHRDEHVRAVAGCEDVVIGEVDLEAGHSGQRAGGRANLGREVRERGEVVAEQRGLAREAVARELHTVTRITREADDHSIDVLDGLGHRIYTL